MFQSIRRWEPAHNVYSPKGLRKLKTGQYHVFLYISCYSAEMWITFLTGYTVHTVSTVSIEMNNQKTKMCRVYLKTALFTRPLETVAQIDTKLWTMVEPQDMF